MINQAPSLISSFWWDCRGQCKEVSENVKTSRGGLDLFVNLTLDLSVTVKITIWFGKKKIVLILKIN